jgi:carboxypeptidase PM20D1
MKRTFGLLAVLLLALTAVLVVRALSLESRQVAVAPAEDTFRVDAAAVGERLAGAIRFQTISLQDGGDRYAAEFVGFEDYLSRSYPRVHAALRRERVGAHSLLYSWPGPDAQAPALLLAAHLDVVPVEPGTESDWEQPPFGGEIVDGVVWGRGAIDDKGGLIAILEAVESLLTEGFTPERGVLLAFGHDEEIGGRHGAAEIAAILERRGQRLAAVVDEGGVVADGIEFVDGPIGLVGIAEKGSVSLKLSIQAVGGHSSTPPPHSGVGIIAGAVRALEENQMPARVDGTTRRFLESLAPELPFAARLALANLWLTEGLLSPFLSSSPPLNAMVRTTTAATMFHGGVKSNVLPKKVEAVVNFRILPGDTVEDVFAHVRSTIDDERIEVAYTGATPPREPSGISAHDSPEFAALQRAIVRTHPDAIVLPYLVVGGTDARFYAGLSDNVYRFGGFRLGAEAMRLAHGTNARVSLENLANAVRFYRFLITDGA